MKNIINSRLVQEEFELQKTLKEDLIIDTEIGNYRQYVKDRICDKLQIGKEYLDGTWYELEVSCDNFSKNSRETILNIAKRTNNLLLNNK